MKSNVDVAPFVKAANLGGMAFSNSHQGAHLGPGLGKLPHIKVNCTCGLKLKCCAICKHNVRAMSLQIIGLQIHSTNSGPTNDTTVKLTKTF